MRVMYVAGAFVPEGAGGTELHAFHLARAMAEHHEVLVFARVGDPDRPDYDIDHIEVDGVQVVRVNYNFGDAESFQWIYRNPNIDSIFASELARFAPDLVHIHHLTCLSTGIIDCVKDAGRGLVMTLHDFWMVCPRGQRIHPNSSICETVDRELCRSCLADLWPHFFPETAPPGIDSRLVSWDEWIQRVLGRVDVLLTPSESHRKRMLEFDLDEDRIVSLPHGLDATRLLRSRTLNRPIKTIGFVGTVIPSKGIHTLVEAFAQLSDASLSLRIHGDAPSFHGDEGYVDRLRATVPAHLDVTFEGRYENNDLPEILEAIDVLVVPSIWWESYCLTLREGLLAGCIVIAANHGAMAERLAGEADGLLFEPGNSKDLAQKISLVRDDDTLRRRLTNRGDTVKRLSAMVRETQDVYRGVLRDLGNPSWDEPVPRAALLPNDSDGAGVAVTVFIPTYNGGPLFEVVLDAVLNQKTEFKYEVLCIDSGSTDETLSIIAARDVRLIEIPNTWFNHGLTRNRAVAEAQGEIVCLLTQDAQPYDDGWLTRLVSNFADPEVAGAYCHQLPRENCNPFQMDRLRGWTHGEGEATVKQVQTRSAYDALTPMERYHLIAFDDVASSVRRSVMQEIPFERRQFGEDVAWGKQAILAGYKLVMDPRSVVVHSHNNSSWYEFKRVYLDHQNLNDLVGMHLVRTLGEVVRFTFSGTRHLGGIIRRSELGFFDRLLWWIRTPAYSLGQNLGQYLGARSSIEKCRGVWGMIDRFLKKGV